MGKINKIFEAKQVITDLQSCLSEQRHRLQNGKHRSTVSDNITITDNLFRNGVQTKLGSLKTQQVFLQR